MMAEILHQRVGKYLRIWNVCRIYFEKCLFILIKCFLYNKGLIKTRAFDIRCKDGSQINLPSKSCRVVFSILAENFLHGLSCKDKVFVLQDFVIPLALVIIGFVANFGLPFQPIIKADEDTYTYAVFSQGGFSDLVLHPISYVNIYASSSHFLCLQPYISFGLCDLMWRTQKIPRHGSIGPKINTPDAVIEIMKNYLNKQVIIPQPLRDKLMPGVIGYYSLYEKPFYFLLGSGKSLLYNNGVYTLFLT